LECPFCKEEIKARSLACGHCGRDISFLVFGEMRGQMDDVMIRLSAIEDAIKALGVHVETTSIRLERDRDVAHSVLGTLAWLALPIILLVFAHWTIISVLDLDTRVLRLVSILIPLPFGLRRLPSVTATLWAALSVAALSVLGMLISTSLTDNVPITPQGARDWIETIQYAASIGLSYLVGSLIVGRWLMRKSSKASSTGIVTEIATVLARGSSPTNENKVQLHHRIAVIAGWINAVMIVITAAGAIVTALGKFWPG